jgi:site-specific DNA-adenine methylase
MGNKGGDSMIKAPFTWFGGKSRAAHIVWPRFGTDVKNYVEPFFGSGAMLLGRPELPSNAIETVNDLDGYVANFWRSVALSPDETWEWADWPVNECDLQARHLWLVENGGDLRQRLGADPEYHDPKIAGWWVWGICSWIGGGWCKGLLKKTSGEIGVSRRLPHLGPPRGINRLRVDPKEENPLSAIARRMRNVRVCCGDWSRICGPSPTYHIGTTAVFLDPPYDLTMRCKSCYNADSSGLSSKVREWCLENQDNPKLRIALCGYEGEHNLPDWDCVARKEQGGYGNQSNKRGRENAKKERIWFSPHCLNSQEHQGTLI